MKWLKLPQMTELVNLSEITSIYIPCPSSCSIRFVHGTGGYRWAEFETPEQANKYFNRLQAELSPLEFVSLDLDSNA